MAAGLPQCVLKRLKAADVLNDPETMENIAKKFSKAQKMAMLQRVSQEGDTQVLKKNEIHKCRESDIILSQRVTTFMSTNSALLLQLTESVTASELMEKVPESLRERLSLNFLKNADVSSLGNKTWNKQQVRALNISYFLFKCSNKSMSPSLSFRHYFWPKK